MSLTALLHRQYKTARTETRRHLLLKIRQMTSQTSASRGYVLFDIKMAFMPSVVWCHKGHTRILKLSAGCGHIRGVFKAWKDMDHRGCLARCGLEMPDFAIRTTACKFHPEHVVILQLTPALLLSSAPPGCAGVFMHTGYSTPPAPGTVSVPRSVSVWNTCSPADTVHSSACTDPRLFRSPHPQTESHSANS